MQVSELVALLAEMPQDMKVVASLSDLTHAFDIDVVSVFEGRDDGAGLAVFLVVDDEHCPWCGRPFAYVALN